MKLNPEIIRKYADEYRFNIDGIEFWCPYFVNTPQVHDDKKNQSLEGPFLGKGSASQLKGALIESLNSTGEKPNSPEEYRHYMHDHLIGVECSGFIFNVASGICDELGLEAIDRHIYWSQDELLEAFDKGIPWHQPNLKREVVEAYPQDIDLETIAKDWGWKESRRLVRAERFWSNGTATKLRGIVDAMPGDIIAMRENTGSNIGHLVMIVDADDKKIQYVHSNRVDGTLGGVSYGEIDIVDPAQSVESQKWNDEDFISTHDVYGIYRLSAFADA